MAQNDTSMGGQRRAFPTTIWSNILAAGDSQSPEYQTQLAQLVQTYWKPVYAYIRVAWHKSVEDAKDLTQAFFAKFLEKDYLKSLRPDRGSFRGYLKKSLQHFLIDMERADAVRRPSHALLSLDSEPEELNRIGPSSPDESPDRAYDREWFRCLFRAAIDSLRQELIAENKPKYFEVFKIYCMDPAGMKSTSLTQVATSPHQDLTYREIGEKLGIQESDVRNYLSYCREGLMEHLRRSIRDYVANDKDVDEELREAMRG